MSATCTRTCAAALMMLLCHEPALAQDNHEPGFAPKPAIVINSETGMAPFAVHAHGLNSELSAGDCTTARYEWNFGDVGGAYNELTGWNAAHIYDQPGTYTITLGVTDEDGQIASAHVDVTILEPKRQNIYISKDGSDYHNGASPDRPVRTIERANQMLRHNTALFFRRGETYTIDTTLALAAHNTLIGAYGEGARPILHWTGNGPYDSIISIQPNVRGVVVENLEFTSPHEPNNSIVRAIMVKGSNITVRDCHFGRVSYAMNSETGVQQWLTLRNTADVIGAYFVWGEGSDHVHLGNVVRGSVDEHNFRLLVERTLIAHNDLTNAAKSTIWAMMGEHCYIAHNALSKGRFCAGPNPAVGDPVERFKWIVFEDNQMFEEGVILYSGAEHVALRDNRIHFDGGTCFSVWGYYEPMQRACRDIAIVNNIGVNEDDEYGRFLRLGNAVNVKVANNRYVAPSLNTQSGAVNVFCEHSDLSAFQFSKNQWSQPAIGKAAHLVGERGLTIDEWSKLPQCADESCRRFSSADARGIASTAQASSDQ